MIAEANQPFNQLTPAWIPLRYHEQQARYYRSSKRFRAVACGRQSGKTEIARRRLVRSLRIQKAYSNPRYFYGGPTRQQAKRISWDALKSLTPKHWIKDISETDLVITTIFGSELHCVGLDKPERIEGDSGGWDGCVLDESCDLKPGVFTRNVLPALAPRNGWCDRIGVPKRTGPSATEYYQFWLQGFEDNTGIDSFNWPSWDIIDSDSLNSLREILDPIDFDEQCGAKWQKAGGRVYHAFDKAANGRPCSYNPSRVVVVGSDFNVDPMCWTIMHCSEQSATVFDELYIRNTNTEHCLNVLNQRYPEHDAGWLFIGDATGASRKTSAASSDYAQILADDRFTKKNVRYPKANPNVADRFAACNALLKNAIGDVRLHIDSSCRKLIEDLEHLAYKEGTTIVDASNKERGHITDALSYVTHRLYPIKIPLAIDNANRNITTTLVNA